MLWLSGLLAGVGLGLVGGVWWERRSLPSVLSVVERTIQVVGESVRFPGSHEQLVLPEVPPQATLFDDLGVDVPAAPSWMMDEADGDVSVS